MISMTIGSGFAELVGDYPFEVRFSRGSSAQARDAADIASSAYVYLSRLFSGFKPDIALIVSDEECWESRQPYGLPYFDNDADQIRPGILVMPAGGGHFWSSIGDDLLNAPPASCARLRAQYPGSDGRLNLQPFFDLVTIHELGHAFEVLGDLKLPTFWLSEMFANLAMHTFTARERRDKLDTLEVIAIEGTQNQSLDFRMRADGCSTLAEFEIHYSGGYSPMSPLNYVWYQYRIQRLVAAAFDVEGEDVLVRFWNYFRSGKYQSFGDANASSIVPILCREVSEVLGRGVQAWC